MTVELIELIAAKGVFRPRGHFTQLAADHVPFDRLVGQDRYETAALQALSSDAPVAVIGPRGAGKSSLIAYVCAHLPNTHVALRVPVTGADDPTSVSVVAAVALTQALDDLDLERYQREALNRARADQGTQEYTPGGLRGATLGGGPIPAQVHAELRTLGEELTTNRLAAERLAGLDQLISFYDETERNLRFTLAALQTAAEYAADMRAHRIAPGHIRAALTDWRSRISP